MPSRRKNRDGGRDGGRFIALPLAVLDSPAYLALSMHARALLLEVARQYMGDNNGQLLLSRAFLGTRGWKSSDMITKAKRELLDGGFLHETVKGRRPHKASWYAVTWQTLDRHVLFDPGAYESFRKGAYRPPPTPAPSREAIYRRWDSQVKNAVLRPSHGTETPQIGPPHGSEKAPPVPPHGPISPLFGPLSVPPHGHHLDMPSPGGEAPWAENMGGGHAAQTARREGVAR